MARRSSYSVTFAESALNPKADNAVRITPQRTVFVADGDSITYGYGLADHTTQSWPAVYAAAYPNVTLYDVGVSGATLRERSAAAANDVDPHYDPLHRSSVVIFAGTNDLYADYTAASTLPVLWAYCDARRAVGWRVYVATMLPRHNNGYLERDAYNAGIRQGWQAHANGLIDTGANLLMGAQGDENNLTYYQADNVHPNATGAALLAGMFIRSIPMGGLRAA